MEWKQWQWSHDNKSLISMATFTDMFQMDTREILSGDILGQWID